VKSFILDVEVVAVERRDLENVRILPFQTLSTRKRKSPGDESTTTTNTTSSGSEVDVCVYAFDCLYLNAEILVDLELSERREHLDTVLEVVGSKGFFDKVTSINVSLDVMEVDDGEEEDEAKPSPDEEIKCAFEEAVKNKCEGLMLKSTKSKYEAGARGGWLKLKKDYIDGLCDTLDCVPIGAWRGTGRKAEKGFFSPWLVAVYDKQNDKFESICRLLSLTDEMYTSKTEFYKQRLLERPSDRYDDTARVSSLRKSNLLTPILMRLASLIAG
jgi:DNA ligase 1